MPSFDIVSKVDLQEVDNAVNNVRKELDTRFDFRNVKTDLDLNRKEKVLHVVTGDEMKIRAIQDLLKVHFTRRKLDPRSLEFKELEATSQGRVKMDILIKEGISKDTAQKIVKLIKAQKLKVQAAIQDEQVRVTGKKIDDLQAVIKLLDDQELDVPLQHVNMKS
ncbi:YajQ family cyclic di-GMP-binding protein [Desulfonatronum sp. SC1]|uniref:YajQ family cyclic di-GMP-binding protein n=1 Tax=Desulfonatronum sp. SC1 TaxID=2109626 RepID=UPI000D3091CD|nr:YajQ family cyclic di-GMP-binding protein [Desulfonatronum sp. SC1]PTN32324.1 YajQ family cyclic di-GMP-binding protein [Desulfonatronum sp. SC1]